MEAVPDRRNNQIQPTVLAGGGVGDKLMTKLLRFLRAAKASGEAVAFGNDAKNREERIADQVLLFSPKKSLSGEINTGKPAREILSKDHIARVLHDVAIAGFEPRSFEQARDFGDEARCVKREFEIIVRPGL